MKYDFNKMRPVDIHAAMAVDTDLRLAVVQNMETYGGSFVKALAKCFLAADRNNIIKLSQAFFDYVLEYNPEKWQKKQI